MLRHKASMRWELYVPNLLRSRYERCHTTLLPAYGISGEERYVTTLITGAKETSTFPVAISCETLVPTF